MIAFSAVKKKEKKRKEEEEKRFPRHIHLHVRKH